MKTVRIRRSQATSGYSHAKMAEAPSIRFWENYLVRYLLGAVVGSAMVWVLLWQVPVHFEKPAILQPSTATDSTFFVILGLAGFAYCYLASQLVLVFHYARWLSPENASTSPTRWLHVTLRGLLDIAIFLMIFGLLLASALKLIINFKLTYISLNQFIALEFGMVPVALQWELMIKVHRRAPDLFSFYESLAMARARGAASEFIESYRHLREHGNALFIVLAEVLFFFYAYAALSLALPVQQGATPVKEGQLLIGATFLVLWLVPGVYAWFLGNKLERRLISQSMHR